VTTRRKAIHEPLKLVCQVASPSRGVKTRNEENTRHGVGDVVFNVEVVGKPRRARVYQVRLSLFGSISLHVECCFYGRI
jgi:hypothetical protein